MTLADDVAEAAPPSRCGVCRWYDVQEQRDREAFDQWLLDGRDVSGLWRLCRANGLTVGRRRFAEHVADCHVAC